MDRALPTRQHFDLTRAAAAKPLRGTGHGCSSPPGSNERQRDKRTSRRDLIDINNDWDVDGTPTPQVRLAVDIFNAFAAGDFQLTHGWRKRNKYMEFASPDLPVGRATRDGIGKHRGGPHRRRRQGQIEPHRALQWGTSCPGVGWVVLTASRWAGSALDTRVGVA